MTLFIIAQAPEPYIVITGFEATVIFFFIILYILRLDQLMKWLFWPLLDIINSMVTTLFMIIVSVLALMPETTTLIILGGYYKITHVKGALGMEIGCPLPGAAQRTAATLALSWTPESVYTPCTTPRLSSHAVTHTGILSAVESGTYFCSLMCCVNFRCPCMHIVPRNPRDLPAGPDLGSAQYRRRATSQGQPRIRRGAAHRG
ncbi:uncharacterized protein LOC104853955 isoform X3 [Fukomys damarensis]|nr:uncharacterized protein LOC104853955 isoform X3 [Fukomys damarensis]